MLFKGQIGHQKVERGEYAIEDRHRNVDIIRTLPFEQSFYPGQWVDMSVVFDHSSAISSCPGCKTESDMSSSSKVVWYVIT